MHNFSDLQGKTGPEQNGKMAAGPTISQACEAHSVRLLRVMPPAEV